MFYKTEDLLDSIKTRTLAPSSQSTFLDTDLIKLANEELQGSLVPDVLSVREDHFLKSKIQTLITGLNHYPMPERAIANSLKDIFLVDSSGNKVPLPRMTIHEMDVSTIQAMPSMFAIKGDEILLVPTPYSTSYTLEVWYPSRPNKLVSSLQVAKVVTISSSGGTTTITLDTDITSTVSAGGTVDFTRSTSPFMNWAEDVIVQTISGTTLTVLTPSVSNELGTVLPRVGDFVSAAQTACIIQLPQELHPILAQMVAARVMESLGDIQKLQSVNAKLSEMRKQAFQMISNRVESEISAVMNKRGILNSLRYNR